MVGIFIKCSFEVNSYKHGESILTYAGYSTRIKVKGIHVSCFELPVMEVKCTQ